MILGLIVILSFLVSLYISFKLTDKLVSRKKMTPSDINRLLLQEKVEEWNQIRGYSPDWRPDLRGVSFAFKNLKGTNFRDALLDNADFTGAVLDYCDFTCASLKNINLEKASLRCAVLDGASLEQSIEQNANLEGVSFENGANQDNPRVELNDISKNFSNLDRLNPKSFKDLIFELFTLMGNSISVPTTGFRSGIDFVLRHPASFFMTETVVMCKYVDKNDVIGASDVKILYNFLLKSNFNLGVLITNGDFTNEAKSFQIANSPLLNLIDGDMLKKLISEQQYQMAPADDLTTTQKLNREIPKIIREKQHIPKSFLMDDNDEYDVPSFLRKEFD